MVLGRIGVAALLVLPFVVSGQAQTTARPPHPPYPAKWEPKPQEIFLSYWTVEPGWSTELEIRNNNAWRDLTVTPVLRTAAGAEIVLSPITVSPDQIASVNVRNALFLVAPELVDGNGSFGSVVYRFDANSAANVFGASMVQRNNSPIGFHFDGEPVEKGWCPATTESVWWVPRSTASDYLILANASSEPLAASLSVSDSAGDSIQRPLTLAPSGIERLDLKAITHAAHFAGTEGGVTVLVPSNGGNLITSHIVFDETVGMSATMKTFERDPGEQPKSHTFRAPMMALVNPDPVLLFPAKTTLVPKVFLRNTTAAPLSATLTLNWRSTNLSGTLPVSTTNLAPHQTRVLDLTASMAGLPADAYWATVVLNYQGRSGDLAPVATSFDETGRYGLQTPFSEGLAHLWKGSMWHVDNFRNSLITAGNGGTGPLRAAVTCSTTTAARAPTRSKSSLHPASRFGPMWAISSTTRSRTGTAKRFPLT